MNLVLPLAAIGAPNAVLASDEAKLESEPRELLRGISDSYGWFRRSI